MFTDAKITRNERAGSEIEEIRACERSASGAENRAEWIENGVSGSGAVGGLNRPLKVRSHQHCVDLVTDVLL